MPKHKLQSDHTSAARARAGKKARSKPGDLKAVAAIVWTALETAQDLLESQDTNQQLRACHAVFQGSAAYAKVLEVGELERRIQALEEKAKLEPKAPTITPQLGQATA